jgi:hypothetical protein
VPRKVETATTASTPKAVFPIMSYSSPWRAAGCARWAARHIPRLPPRSPWRRGYRLATRIANRLIEGVGGFFGIPLSEGQDGRRMFVEISDSVIRSFR